jgi:cell wall-associated NlpC family hydrolase
MVWGLRMIPIDPSTELAAMLRWAYEMLARKVPYIWGGKDPAVGLDCSGFVTGALLVGGGPDWRHTYNTDALWAHCPHVSEPEPGDAIIYRGATSSGPADVEHVMLYVGGGLCIGQPYGGHANKTTEYSKARGHWTHILDTNYRSDIAGFVQIPYKREVPNDEHT